MNTETLSYADFKNKVISELKELNKTAREFHFKNISDDFIRGYLIGAETMHNIPIGSYDYDEIIKTINGECKQ